MKWKLCLGAASLGLLMAAANSAPEGDKTSIADDMALVPAGVFTMGSDRTPTKDEAAGVGSFLFWFFVVFFVFFFFLVAFLFVLFVVFFVFGGVGVLCCVGQGLAHAN